MHDLYLGLYSLQMFVLVIFFSFKKKCGLYRLLSCICCNSTVSIYIFFSYLHSLVARLGNKTRPPQNKNKRIANNFLIEIEKYLRVYIVLISP